MRRNRGVAEYASAMHLAESPDMPAERMATAAQGISPVCASGICSSIETGGSRPVRPTEMI